MDDKPIRIDTTPDTPISFGRKAVWFAVRSSDHKDVAATLKLSQVESANWHTGIQLAFNRNLPDRFQEYVFVAPALNGWVFILSPHFFYTADQINSESHLNTASGFDLIFSSLYSKYPDVQVFGSHRGVSAIIWGRALDGEIQRLFFYADGMVFANYGETTKQEHTANILDIGGLSIDAAYDAINASTEEFYSMESELVNAGKSPEEIERQLAQSFKILPGSDEDLHFRIAEQWSINPNNLSKMGFGKGVGLIGKLPEAMAGQY